MVAADAVAADAPMAKQAARAVLERVSRSFKIDLRSFETDGLADNAAS